MPRAGSAVPLLAPVQDVIRWLKSQRIPHVLIGGVAASLLGRPRLTDDVDLLVLLDEAKWEDFLKTAPAFGFLPRRSDALEFARRSRVLLIRHKATDTDIDILVGSLPFEIEAVAGSRRARLGKLTVAVPAPEDFIIMKAVGNRPRDLADIEAVLDSQPGLDLRRIRRIVRNFSEALEMPGMLNDLEAILAKKRKTFKKQSLQKK